jgi:hypothetical protein
MYALRKVAHTEFPFISLIPHICKPLCKNTDQSRGIVRLWLFERHIILARIPFYSVCNNRAFLTNYIYFHEPKFFFKNLILVHILKKSTICMGLRQIFLQNESFFTDGSPNFFVRLFHILKWKYKLQMSEKNSWHIYVVDQEEAKDPGGRKRFSLVWEERFSWSISCC